MQNVKIHSTEQPGSTNNRWLIATFSRSGQTLRAARQLSTLLPSDLIEIRCPRNYSAAPFGFFRALTDTVLDRRLPYELDGAMPDCSNYRGVIVASPIWAGSIPPQMQGFLEAHARDIKAIAVLLTCGGTGEKKAIAKIESITHLSPIASLLFLEKELAGGIQSPEISERFRSYINSLETPGVVRAA